MLFNLHSLPYSCTSASIATVARDFNIDIGEKKAAELTRLTRFGADSGQIRYALGELTIGYETLNGKHKELKEIKPPAISYEGHAVVKTKLIRYGIHLKERVISQQKRLKITGTVMELGVLVQTNSTYIIISPKKGNLWA